MIQAFSLIFNFFNIASPCGDMFIFSSSQDRVSREISQESYLRNKKIMAITPLKMINDNLNRLKMPREFNYAFNYCVITRDVFFSSSHALLRVHEKPTRKYSLFVIITSFFFKKNIFSKKILIFSIVVIMRNHGNQNILSSNYA